MFNGRIIACLYAGLLLLRVSIGDAHDRRDDVSAMDCRGTVIPAGANIQDAISAGTDGETFCLAAGIWHRQHIIPKRGQSFIGVSPEATILTGDDVTPDLVTDGAGSDVLLQNLTITHYAGRAVHGSNVGWRYVNIQATDNNVGLYLYAGATVTGGRFAYNRHSGLNDCCNAGPVIIRNAEIDHNNTNHDDVNEDAAGAKFEAENIFFLNNYVHDNYGQGVWCDIHCSHVEIAGNKIANNVPGNGIMYEISYGPCLMSRNLVTNNGTAGIYISNSQGCDVGQNIVEVAKAQQGIPTGIFGGIIEAFDRRPRQDDPANCCRYQGNYNTTNNRIHDNVIVFRGSSAAKTGYAYDYNRSGRQFINIHEQNTYYVPDTLKEYWFWDGVRKTWAQWQALRQDSSGTRIIGLP